MIAFGGTYDDSLSLEMVELVLGEVEGVSVTIEVKSPYDTVADENACGMSSDLVVDFEQLGPGSTSSQSQTPHRFVPVSLAPSSLFSPFSSSSHNLE